ncbi:hypothetical protein C8Q74DRAFT_259192 [Fomes fomentarius]|nr:hypothetical protein C8Q74DRAFT_259192 [Fomes fomentarius]
MINRAGRGGDPARLEHAHFACGPVWGRLDTSSLGSPFAFTPPPPAHPPTTVPLHLHPEPPVGVEISRSDIEKIAPHCARLFNPPRPLVTQCAALFGLFVLDDTLAQQAFDKKGTNHDLQ